MSHPLSVTVETGSRLHFGPLTNGLSRGRLFGGIGMMIDVPAARLEIRPAETDSFEASPPVRDKIEPLLERVRGEISPLRPLHVQIETEADLHSGLGTGSQLSLAVVAALLRLANEDLSADRLAELSDRGKRSALGIHGFLHGGFLLDGGKRRPDQVGTLLARFEVPESWRLVLVTPTDRSGLSGEAEAAAFRDLQAMPLATTGELSRLVLLEILPALAERNFSAFAAGLHAYGSIVGDYFADIQGGRYAHPTIGELVTWLGQRGVTGTGQTSWGPSLFALVEQTTQANELAAAIQNDPRWNGCRVRIARPLNRGASVAVS
jgi:beta-ribofuranosylaminobenzene 5'-phosphate synthase